MNRPSLLIFYATLEEKNLQSGEHRRGRRRGVFLFETGSDAVGAAASISIVRCVVCRCSDIPPAESEQLASYFPSLEILRDSQRFSEILRDSLREGSRRGVLQVEVEILEISR